MEVCVCDGFGVDECCFNEWSIVCGIKVKVFCGFCVCGDGVCSKEEFCVMCVFDCGECMGDCMIIKFIFGCDDFDV